MTRVSSGSVMMAESLGRMDLLDGTRAAPPPAAGSTRRTRDRLRLRAERFQSTNAPVQGRPARATRSGRRSRRQPAGYDRRETETCAPEGGAVRRGDPFRWPRSPPTTERAHKATKRYIYAWGDGHGRGRRRHARPPRRQGRRPRRDDERGPAGPARLHDHDRGLQRLLRGRRAAAPGPAGTTSSRPSREVERRAGKGFGDAANPLLVSVRSGAKFSMPGMMDTVLNLGLNEETLQGLVALTGNERFGWDAYRRFIAMFGRIVMDVDGAGASTSRSRRRRTRAARSRTRTSPPSDLRELASEFQAIVRERHRRATSRPIPYEQLDLAIKAVFASWFGKRAQRLPRSSTRSPHDLGTAVNVVTMVFGNMGDDSGTGVAFTRDPNTGEDVAVRRVPHQRPGRGRRGRHPDAAPKIAQMATDMPEVYARVPADRRAAREALPRRPGPRVHDRARQAVHAPDALGEADRGGRGEDRGRHGRGGPHHEGGGASRGSSRRRSTSCSVPSSTEARQGGDADRQGPERLAGRRGRAGGLRRRRRGRVGRPRREGDPRPRSRPARTTSTAWPSPRASSPPVAARPRTPRSSRARSASRASPAAAELQVDYAAKHARRTPSGATVNEGDWISIDGSTGEVFVGALPTVEARFEDQPDLQTILGWADEIRRMGVWTNADKPEEAARARELRRPGDRPLPDRAHVPRGRAARDRPRRDPRRDLATRAKARRDRGEHAHGRRDGDDRDFDAAMGKLEALQQGDFEGIFRAMDGLPVVIRLIDPPLHEFLPNLEEQLVKVTTGRERRRRDAPEDHGAAHDDRSRCTSRTRCSGCAAAASG